MILCCGEALIDLLPDRTADGRRALVPQCGGALFNTAIGLGQMGASVGMLTGLSTDPFGQQIRISLERSGVDTASCVESDGPTTLALVHLVDGDATYSFFDKGSALQQLGKGRFPNVPTGTSVLVLGGISLCNAPVADALLGLARREAGKRLIYLDPNIRPGFADDPQAWRQRLNAVMPLCDVVKLSQEDAAWMLPELQHGEEIVRTLTEMGPELVILTQGAKGALAYKRGGEPFHMPTEAVEVVDTIGAGDAFNAGVLAQLQRAEVLTRQQLSAADDDLIRECVRSGAQRAAFSLSHKGAVLLAK